MQDDIEYKRAMVLGLAFSCPLCEAHADCAMRDIRSKSSALEKHQHVKNLSVEAIEDIYEHHSSCLDEREMNRIFNEQLKRSSV